VRVNHHERGVREEAAVGDGPIDATFKALARATGVDGRLTGYKVQSVTVGEDAQGRGRPAEAG
jgi:2-isopropylmalate synthase